MKSGRSTKLKYVANVGISASGSAKGAWVRTLFLSMS